MLTPWDLLHLRSKQTLYKLEVARFATFKNSYLFCRASSTLTFVLTTLQIKCTFDSNMNFYLHSLATTTSEIGHFYLVNGQL